MGRVALAASHRPRAGCPRNCAVLLLDNTGTGTCCALEVSTPQAFVVNPVSGEERETGECRRRCRWYERPAWVAFAKMQLPRVRVIVCDPDSMHVRVGQKPFTALPLSASPVETSDLAVDKVHCALVGRLVRGHHAVVGAKRIPSTEHHTPSHDWKL
jgi:hypothetical protein